MSSILSPKQPNVVGYWPFNEASGSTTYDYSDLTNNGTITGATYNKIQDGEYVLDFNGSSDTLDFSSSIIDTSSSFSASYWVNLDVDSTNQIMIGNGDNTNGWYMFFVGGSNYIRSKMGSVSHDSDTINLTAGSWFHIVATYDGSTYKVYINGEEFQSVSATGVVANDNFYIGYWGATPGLYVNGKMRLPILYDAALSADEVKKLYQEQYIN